ncbi:hypothetical protein [Ruegeria sp. Ofav3-42]|uniref:hypothetical protein n=1 Tax=Ruegeria sp. Ofav3-42 TaxID=2917759 RepID=UPI001EF74592|nr:hypothetical protein [Ruegeria sp. Ofav3-42]MCG7520861.1 hypothetical protein [Ruegeria sp. Ofav3-42]
MNDAPERVVIHHADQIKTDGTSCLVFTSDAPRNFKASQTGYIREDISPAAVTVKPLEWKPQPDGIQYWGVGPGAIFVVHDFNEIETRPEKHFEYSGDPYQTLDEAKAAAQADYKSRILSALTPAPVADVSILTMKLSGNRKEHWVRITYDGRTFDVRKYDGEHRNRAEYERDTLRHVLLGEPKPDLMDGKYADPEPAPVAALAKRAAFPKRCEGGDVDAFNGDCLWCGAPMGGTCQEAALRTLSQEGQT